MSRGAYFNAPFLIYAFIAGVALRSFFNVPGWLVLGGIGIFVGMGAFLILGERFSERVSASEPPKRGLSGSDTESVSRKNAHSSQEPQTEGPGFFSAEKTLKTRAGRAPYVLQFAVLGVALLLGILRFSVFENNISKDELHNHYGENMILNGTVISAKLTQKSQQIIVSTGFGRLLATKKVYPQYKYGDILQVQGKILEPVNFGNFDVKKYLAKDEIYSEMAFPVIARTDENGGDPVFAALFAVKDKFEENLQKILPEPHASLADGMLLGNQSALPQELLDDFRKSGTIHILVLSGYNITIVGAFVFAFFGSILPEAASWFLATAAILGFTLMSGAEAAAVRSAIMAIIGLVALHSGRKHIAFLALAWAAFLMILWNPMLLSFDRGFQLSFLATLGLIAASPFFKKIFFFLPDFAGLRENAASAFAAQIFVLPLLLSWGGEISWLSPVANIFIVGAVPAVMLFSFFGGIFSFASVYLGKVIASAAFLLIAYQVYLVKFFGSLDFSMIQFGFLPLSLLFLVYFILFYWSARSYAKIL